MYYLPNGRITILFCPIISKGANPGERGLNHYYNNNSDGISLFDEEK
jgi:hypothetical protein